MRQCLLLLVVFSFLLRHDAAAQQVAAEREKANKALRSPAIDTTQVESLLFMTADYVLKPGENKTHIDSAELLLRRAEKESKKLAYKKGIARSYLYYAMLFRETNRMEEGQKYCDSALHLSK